MTTELPKDALVSEGLQQLLKGTGGRELRSEFAWVNRYSLGNMVDTDQEGGIW
jgi:hypothetical protein